MSNDALHERLYRDTLQPTQPSVSVQDTQDSMPVISEEYTLDSPTASSNTVMTALQTPSSIADILPGTSASPTIRRRSNRVHQWIEEQQSRPDSIAAEDTAAVELAGALSHLTLSGQSMPCFSKSNTGDAQTLSSYVVLEEDDEIHSPATPRGQLDEEAEDVIQSPPIASSSHRSSPAVNTSHNQRPYSGLFHAPSSLRNFHLSLSPGRRLPGTPGLRNPPSSPSARHSIFQRPHTSSGHARAPSAGSGASATGSVQDGPSTPRSSRSYSNWKLKRPSVLGAFGAAAPRTATHPDDFPDDTTSRPSFSSTRTFSSGTTGTSADLATPQKGSPASGRATSTSRHKASSPSLWSLPSDASHLRDPPGSESVLSLRPPSVRAPFALKMHGSNLPHLRNVPSVLSSGSKRKRKLVINGISIHDQRRYENARRWCESFGEVNQITRMPNGDLHVDFRRSEVADTVCRVNAQVLIAGVGSVSLSWYTGKRP